VQHCINSATPQ